MWDVPGDFPWKNRVYEMANFWPSTFLGNFIVVRLASPPMTEPFGPIEFISHDISAEADPAAMLSSVRRAALQEALFAPGYNGIQPVVGHPIALMDLFGVDGSGKIGKVVTQQLPVRVLVLPFSGVSDEVERLEFPESLEKLVMYNTTFDVRLIEKFAKCPKLREVVFWGCSMVDYNLARLSASYLTSAEASQGGKVRLAKVSLINCSEGLVDWAWLANRDSLETIEIGPNPKPLSGAIARAGILRRPNGLGSMRQLVIYSSTTAELNDLKSMSRFIAISLSQKLNLTAPGSVRLVPLKAQ